MPSGYRVGKPEPEFYFHFELGRPITEQEIARLTGDLQRIAGSAFNERFAGLDVEFEFEVDLETGSIRGWIRVKKRTLAAILIGTGAFLSQYGSIRSGAQSLWEDMTWVWDNVKPRVEQLVDQTAGVQERIRTERRRGAVARLDHLIVQYQHGEISYDEYMAEAVAILEKIQQSPDREQIIPALREYMDARNVDWERLARNVPQVPGDPAPPPNTPPPGAAILPGDHNRRRREEDE